MRKQSGFINLGIIGLIVLTAGLFAVTKLASNPNLTFFNTSSEAAGIDQEKCLGCLEQYELRWDRKTATCKRRLSAVCKKSEETSPSCEAGDGKCFLSKCDDVNYVNSTGSCSTKGAVCCKKKSPTTSEVAPTPVTKNLNSGERCLTNSECRSGKCGSSYYGGPRVCVP